MLDLAVIIVSWNVRDLLLDTLRTVYADLETTALRYEVVVVDNASSDDSVAVVRQHFPQVTLLAESENWGFAGGNNRGMAALGFGTKPSADLPRAVYLLNSDTLTQQGATQTLFDALMHDSRVGVVGARLTYGDGSFQHSSFYFPDLRQLWAEFFPTLGRLREGRFNGRYPRELYQGTQPFEVDFMLGATMLLRREVIEQTGMFDPQFFMYCEEIDWQWRIRKAGWRIRCVPQAHVVHLGGQSTSQVKPRSIINLWDSRLRLFKKHYSPLKAALARRMIVVGMEHKIAQAQTAGESAEIIQAYQTVKELAQG